jgi:hypothetical protein
MTVVAMGARRTGVLECGFVPVAFEFMIFCDDFGGIDTVPRIWNTNGGNRFQTAV